MHREAAMHQIREQCTHYMWHYKRILCAVVRGDRFAFELKCLAPRRAFDKSTEIAEKSCLRTRWSWQKGDSVYHEDGSAQLQRVVESFGRRLSWALWYCGVRGVADDERSGTYNYYVVSSAVVVRKAVYSFWLIDSDRCLLVWYWFQPVDRNCKWNCYIQFVDNVQFLLPNLLYIYFKGSKFLFKFSHIETQIPILSESSSIIFK